jgi:hypothetical protein
MITTEQIELFGGCIDTYRVESKNQVAHALIQTPLKQPFGSDREYYGVPMLFSKRVTVILFYRQIFPAEVI